MVHHARDVVVVAARAHEAHQLRCGDARVGKRIQMARELDLRQALRQIQTAFDPHLLGDHLEERVDLGNSDGAKHRLALLARDRDVSHST